MKKLRFVLWLTTCSVFVALLVSGCHRDSAATKPPVLIAVVSDYSISDAAMGEFKGSVFSVYPQARIVDAALNLEPLNTLQASYILNQATHEFPSGTVIVAAVAPNQIPVKPPVLLLTEAGKYYLGPDNGVFSMILSREKLTHAWKLDNPEFYRNKQPSVGFVARDILGPVAAYLVGGNSPKTIGTVVKKADLEILSNINASVSGTNITAQVIHVDNFGNLITNVSADQANFIKEGNLVRLGVGTEVISAPLVKNLSELPKGRVGLIYNSQNLLQICISQGSAAKQLNGKPGSTVTIRQ